MLVDGKVKRESLRRHVAYCVICRKFCKTLVCDADFYLSGCCKQPCEYYKRKNKHGAMV